MKREWTDLEFTDWTLLPSEAALLANKTGPTRLGFAVLLKFFQYAARFPLSMQEVPTTVVAYIAGQVGVPAEEFSRYDWEGRAVKYHRAQIRAFLGFREPTVQDAEELAVWLSEHVLPQGHPDEHVNAAAYQRLHDLGIEPPTPDRLDRILASASSAFEERFCTETVSRLPPATLGRLETLLSAATEGGETPESEHSPLQQLKTDPGRAASITHSRRLASCDSSDGLTFHRTSFVTLLRDCCSGIGNAQPWRTLTRSGAIPRHCATV